MNAALLWFACLLENYSQKVIRLFSTQIKTNYGIMFHGKFFEHGSFSSKACFETPSKSLISK